LHRYSRTSHKELAITMVLLHSAHPLSMPPKKQILPPTTSRPLKVQRSESLRGDSASPLCLPNSVAATPPQASHPFTNSGMRIAKKRAKLKSPSNVKRRLKPSTEVKALPKGKTSSKTKASTEVKASPKGKTSSKVKASTEFKAITKGKASIKVKTSAKLDNSAASAASNVASQASSAVGSIKDHRIGDFYAQIVFLRSFQMTKKQLEDIFPCPPSLFRVLIPCHYFGGRVRLHQMQKLITISHLCVTLSQKLLNCQGQWSKISSKDALRRATSILARCHVIRLPIGPPTHATKLESDGVGHSDDYVRCLALHPFLPLLATGSNITKLWLVNSNGTEVTCTATLKGHKDGVSSVAFHPLLVTGSYDKTAKFWLLNFDGTAATCTATLGPHTCYVSCVVFHPHLPLLATGSNDTAKLWLVNSNGTSATCTATLGGHKKHISSVAFHPCLPLVATICMNFSLKVWVLNSEGTAATCTASLKGKGFSVCYSLSVTFHPHLPLLAADCDGECKLWLLNFDYTSATCAATFYGMFDFIGFHPCLPLLAIRSKDNTVKLWSLNSDGTAATCTSTLKGIIGDSGYTSGSVAFHPRLPLLATVFYSLQLSQEKRALISSTTSFRFCFCPEPRPQMPVVHMLAGGSTGTALEHGRSGFWTSKGAPYSMNMFDSDSDGN
jgi:hypothetical protein